jgi:pantoate--beta-alanine ligase
MQIFREIEPLRAFLVEKRGAGKSIGLVPTMGALHEGHLTLLKQARSENDVTVCSIYVNPTQFNNPEDLANYPRTLEQDAQQLRSIGCDAVFAPESAEMYNTPNVVRFDFGHLDKVMEGAFRPGHFSGVALVVSKLFHIVEPHRAYFGQKDWQQFAIISTLARELKFNLELKSVPTVREANGLAMSSRNLRLTPEQRAKAAVLSGALRDARVQLTNKTSIDTVKQFVKSHVESDAEITLEYFEVADSENLMPLNRVEDSAKPILCIAAFVGQVRLIDNMFL